jgi:hypothetical protein
MYHFSPPQTEGGKSGGSRKTQTIFLKLLFSTSIFEGIDCEILLIFGVQADIFGVQEDILGGLEDILGGLEDIFGGLEDIFGGLEDIIFVTIFTFLYFLTAYRLLFILLGNVSFYHLLKSRGGGNQGVAEKPKPSF